ncbi:MAG: hypothetical protein RJA16_337 [Planctomycetota bacterium]|jgi:hypothetical protein
MQPFQAVFRSLSVHEVRYLVVGGVAAIVHGVPRTTFDLDLLVEANEENARRLLEALEDAGIGSAALTTPEAVVGHEITVIKDRIRIDLLTRIPGIDFLDAWARREMRSIDGVEYWLISRADLVTAKRASGRPKDLEDADALQNS